MASLSEYLYKRKIEIDANIIDSDLTNYPVMVKLYYNSSIGAWNNSTTYNVGDFVKNKNGYFKCLVASTTKEPRTTTDWQNDWHFLGEEFNFSKIRSDAKDIKFTLDDGSTLLDYEKELFDISSEPYQCVFHIRIPSVSASVNTGYYMYYGCENEDASGENVNGVWNSNYMMVQHMGTSFTDSTSNGIVGTVNGTSVIDSLNGKGRSFNGTSDYISLNANAALRPQNAISLLFLVNFSSFGAGTDQDILIRSGEVNDSTGDNYAFEQNDGLLKWGYNGVNSRTVASGRGGMSLGTWHHLEMSGEYSQNAKIFVDGIDKADTYGTQTTAANNVETVYLGGKASADDFGGVIDEVRIMDIACSDAWVKADYYNLRLWEIQDIGGEQSTKNSGNFFIFI